MKPIVRWTIGDKCSPLGLVILREAVSSFVSIYKQIFDYYIQYNFDCFDQKHKEEKLKDALKDLDVNFKKQIWSEIPVGVNKPENKIFSRVDNLKDSGSIWKICPPRINIKTHEIIMDNDIVIYKKIPEIDQFLNSHDKLLVLEDPIKYYGVYYKNHDDSKVLNSGLFGLYPDYDFSENLKYFWNENGSFKKLSYSDEQGFICGVLRRSNNIVISKNTIVEMHCKGLCKNYKPNIKTDNFMMEYTNDLFNEFYNNGCGIHFVQSNTKDHHLAWDFFKKKRTKKLFV